MSSYYDELLAKAGKRTRARKFRPHEPNPDPVRTLADVAFASDAARELAEAEGLTFEDFARSEHGASGKSGYVTDDVRKIAHG